MSSQPQRQPKPRPPKFPPRKNTKITGERSESDFQSAAIHRNFGVAKPWGDSLRYDFILDNGRCLYRVQVKCTESIRAQAYETRATYTTGKGRAVYTKADIDFIAAHIVPLDIFYIIPIEVCTPAPMLRFYPHRQAKRMRLEKYREAWHLLEDDAHGCKVEININASADENVDHPTIVIPSGDTDPQSGSVSQSRACPEQAKRAEGDPVPSSAAYSATKPVRLPKSAAPWPIPPLRIFHTRQGKRILPDPPTQ